jgi:hypothetical protein
MFYIYVYIYSLFYAYVYSLFYVVFFMFSLWPLLLNFEQALGKAACCSIDTVTVTVTVTKYL